ncbi:hypothetical protein FOMA001_g9794 [Fusarium oxysporum f. sp. matthiolae]|nr:hypothetical protein FOMA001_g9794 [Fusarium oxysporum f. sp. matthiolae]
MGDVGPTTTVNGSDVPKDVVYMPLHVLPGFKLSGEDLKTGPRRASKISTN